MYYAAPFLHGTCSMQKFLHPIPSSERDCCLCLCMPQPTPLADPKLVAASDEALQLLGLRPSEVRT